MSGRSPERVRIGDSHGRIVRVGPDAVEYVDAAGVARAIDLASCRRAPESRTVGLRGALDNPPWFEFFGPGAVRMEFESDKALYQQLVVPLGRAGYSTLDGC
jgi:hypothetical protein